MAVLDVDDWAVLNWMRLLACWRCKRVNATVSLRPAATAYTDPKDNAPLLLCDACAEDYYEYWKNQWDEYNRSRG